MTMFKEQPQIEFPEELQRMGFEDLSYRNDAAAWATKQVAPKLWLGIWISEENPEDREFREFERYHLCSMDNADGLDESEAIYSGESLQELLTAIERSVTECKGKP
jgi:hypothetical protein